MWPFGVVEVDPLADDAPGLEAVGKVVQIDSLVFEGAPQPLYEDFYCARGDMENRIKEQQLDLFADRTSAATMCANQLRLYLSSAAYMLMHALRRLGLKDTPLARAQCQTIRLKLLKIGARIRLTVRTVWISMSEAYPYAEVFATILRNLQSIPLRC